MSGRNPLELSDEEFLNMVEPDSPGSPVEEEPSDDQVVAAQAPATPEASEAAPTGVAAGEAAADPNPTPNPGEAAAGEPAATPEGEAAKAAGAEGEKPAAAGEAEEKSGEAPNYQAFYEQVMKPFKANGKMIELRSPEEAVQLMQMGANYTRKMQELQPHRKTVMMLQNAQIDPERLSFLIDLEKGDPEALKKFLKDREIDPLDIDLSTDPAYRGGDHQVSDQQVTFIDRLEELRSTDAGKELLAVVHNHWDTPSKEMLWENPDVLPVMQEQRESGVYDIISAEIDRQRMLGKLRADMPFLEAYTIVGQQLVEAQVKAGASEGNAPAAAVPVQEAPETKVLGTSVATPKSAVANNEQAVAASPSRGTPATQQNFVNPLAMPDDEFLKQMANRV